jgi:hypothetical protein
VGRTIARSAWSVTSVLIFEAFFGHANHTPPACVIFGRTSLKRFLISDFALTKTTATSNGDFPLLRTRVNVFGA